MLYRFGMQSETFRRNKRRWLWVPAFANGDERKRIHLSDSNKPPLRTNGSRECAPDDRLREAIHCGVKNGLLRRKCSSQ